MRIFFSLLLIFSFSAFSQTALKFQPLTSPVQDEAGIFSSQFINNYARTLKSIFKSGGPQIQVVTVKSLQDYPIEEFTIRLAEKWKIGRKGKNDGVILIIAPIERKVRIEVGSDLEGDLTDFDTHMIIEKKILPAFKQGNFEQGAGLAINDILKELQYSDYLKDQKYVTVQKHVRSSKEMSLFPFLILLLFYPFIRKLFKNRLLSGVASGGVLSTTSYFLLAGGAGTIGLILIMFFVGFVFGLIGPLNLLMHVGSGRGGGGGFGGGSGGWSGGGGGFSGGGSSGSW